MPKLNARERLISGLTLLALSIFVIDRYVWFPVEEKLKELDRAVMAGKSQLVHDRRLLMDSATIRKQYATLALASRDGEKNNPASEIITTLEEIESLAQNSGVKINNIKPQSAQGRPSASSSVFLSIETAWDPLMHFVYQVQRSPQLLEIQKADVQGKGEDGSVLTGQFIIGRAKGDEKGS